MNAVEKFIYRLSSLQLKDCFNPYADTCEIYDRKDAPAIRRENLYEILSSLGSAPTVDLWVGRDLGYRGGRRTGIALTDEVSLDLYASHLKLPSLRRATSGPAVKERTAANIFRIIAEVNVPILTWNVFPLHPYQSGNSFSNRQHTKAEAEIGMTFLEELCAVFSIQKVVAIGNDAAEWTQRLSCRGCHVRHPSYGGQNVFIQQMQKLYKLSTISSGQLKLL